MTLAFEPLSHSYSWDGERVPSVTAVLKPLQAYYRVSETMLRPYAERGSAVHALTEAWDVAGEPPADMDQKLAGYLKAWIDFRRDHSFTPMAVEHRVFHPLHRYAGTIDRIGRVRDQMAVVDIKTSVKLGPAVGVQLAAYLAAWNHGIEPTLHAVGRYAVQLASDGTYRLVEYTSVYDWPAFVGCLALLTWQQEVKGAPQRILLGDDRPRVLPQISEESQWAAFQRTAQRGI